MVEAEALVLDNDALGAASWSGVVRADETRSRHLKVIANIAGRGRRMHYDWRAGEESHGLILLSHDEVMRLSVTGASSGNGVGDYLHARASGVKMRSLCIIRPPDIASARISS